MPEWIRVNQCTDRIYKVGKILSELTGRNNWLQRYKISQMKHWISFYRMKNELTDVRGL